MNDPVNTSKPKQSVSATQVLVVLLLVLMAGGAAYWWFTPSIKQNISGTVTRGGKALVWPKELGQLHVIFVPEVRTPDELPTRAECDSIAGTYRVTQLKAGRYRVAVHMFDEHHNDALGNKFDPGNSPIYHEVNADGQTINIDVPAELPGGGRKKNRTPEGD